MRVDSGASDVDQRARVAALQLGLDLAHRQRAISGVDRAAVEGDFDQRTADLDLDGEALDDAAKDRHELRRLDAFALRGRGDERLGRRAGVQRADRARGLGAPPAGPPDGLLEPLGRVRACRLHGLLPAAGRLAQAKRDAGLGQASVGAVPVVRLDRVGTPAAPAQRPLDRGDGRLGNAELEFDLAHRRSIVLGLRRKQMS